MGPWLPGGKTVDRRGVDEQREGPDSLLNFTKDIISLRRGNKALRFGEYISLNSDDDALLCFGRGIGPEGQRLLMVFNFSQESKSIKVSKNIRGEVLRSTMVGRTHEPVVELLNLQPHEGCIISLAAL